MTSLDNGWYYYYNALITMTIPCDVTISFDWSYTQEDVDSDAFWDPFGYYLNGNYYDITDPNVGDQSGTETISLSAGDVYELYQSSYDGILGVGQTTITNFTATEAATVTRTGGLASGSIFPVGTTTVTYEAEDCQGNTSTCSFDVTITDDEAPSVSCDDITVTLSGGTASIVPADVYNSGSDNCGTVNLVSVSPNSFNSGDVGDNTVTLTVNDGNGNTNSCTATVFVDPGLTTDLSYSTTELTCSTTSILLDASGSSGSGSLAYDWTGWSNYIKYFRLFSRNLYGNGDGYQYK